MLTSIERLCVARNWHNWLRDGASGERRLEFDFPIGECGLDLVARVVGSSMFEVMADCCLTSKRGGTDGGRQRRHAKGKFFLQHPGPALRIGVPFGPIVERLVGREQVRVVTLPAVEIAGAGKLLMSSK